MFRAAETSTSRVFRLESEAGSGFYASRHFGFKIQAEWLPVFADPHVAFICGSGCVVHVGGGTLSSQGEVLAGPLLRF